MRGFLLSKIANQQPIIYKNSYSQFIKGKKEQLTVKVLLFFLLEFRE
jgi:hypothetical protein